MKNNGYSNKTVPVLFFGERYDVPEEHTVLMALEYCGFQIKHGVGCRSGICGSCTCRYRLDGESTLRFGLVCQMQVIPNMQLIDFPLSCIQERIYDLSALQSCSDPIRTVFPEIDRCVSCRSCTNVCPKGIDVMAFISSARCGDVDACTEESFSCVSCGACESKCPVHIPQSSVGLLARRLRGVQISSTLHELKKRVNEIERGAFSEDEQKAFHLSREVLETIYRERDIEQQVKL